jgi:hypothetical protein
MRPRPFSTGRQPPPLPPITAPWAWSPAAKLAVQVIALAALLALMVPGLAHGADPTGAATGTAADVLSQVRGSPTSAEVAAELGRVKVSLNLFFLIFGGSLA